jgi:D-serine deaminase-like pyridoxal phosphate-dependent protein
LIQTGGERSGVIVSTLAEARLLATSGFEDVLYAVPLGLDKVEPVCAIAAKLPGLQVLIDSHAALDALLAALEQTTTVPLPMGVWLKVDCGYHRAGLGPHDATLLSLAQRIHESQFVRLAGTLAVRRLCLFSSRPAHKHRWMWTQVAPPM